MRRGFMAEATALACQVRAELEIGMFAPLDPRALAGSLEVPVWTLSGMLEQSPDVGYPAYCRTRTYSRPLHHLAPARGARSSTTTHTRQPGRTATSPTN